MAKKLTDLTREGDGKRALDSTERLADFNYPLDLDGLTPEETEEHQRMAEAIEFSQMQEDYARKEMKAKYEFFLNAVRNSGVNVENIYSNMPTKMRHLKEIMGYNVLIGEKGKPVKLKDAKSSRIGKAYLHTYNQARKSLNK